MDYIPVYEGEDSDDGSVKLSPGKIQRTGAKSEPVIRQPIRSIVRAPGTVQEDERRISVVALRFEGFVESVANVTTGEHVHKGQVLMNVYSPALFGRGCRISLRHQCGRHRPGAEGRPAQAGESRDARARHQGAGTHTRNLALDSLACAAGWRNPRTQRGERHAGRARRRAVQDRRSSPGLGAARRRGTRSRADQRRHEGHDQATRARAARPSPARWRWSIRISTPRRGPHASASRCPIPTRRCGRKCMSMPRSKPARRRRCWRCRKARCSTAVRGRPCWSTRARAASSRARSSSAAAAAAMSRSPTASPKARRSSPAPTS